MALLRKQKQVSRASRAASASMEGFTKLVAGWNSLMLREGDQVEVGDSRPSEQDAGPRQNRFCTVGTLRMAWRAIGDLESRGVGHNQVDVRSSHRAADALLTMAALTRASFDAAMEKVLPRVLDSGSLVIVRGYDSTPVLVRFGSLQPLLEPVARYLVKQAGPDGRERWAAVPWEEYRARCPGAQTSSGVVEVMAQRLDVRWVQDGGVQHRRVHVPPMMLERSNAACTFEGLERAFPALGAQQLSRLGEQGGAWVVLSESPDSSSANLRAQAHLASIAGGNVLFAPGHCLAHRVHAAVARATKEVDVVGNVHAVSFVLRIAGRRAQVWRALEEIIMDELIILPGPPDPAVVEVNRKAAEHTLLRFQEEIRSHVLRGVALDEAAGKRLRTGAENLVARLDGDWRTHRIQTHTQAVVVGAADGEIRKQTCREIHSALIGSFAFGGLITTPAKQRWGTCNKVLGSQVCGELCHGLLHRAFARAFPSWAATEEPADDEERESDDFHKKARSKVSRVLKWTGSPSQQRFAAVTTVVSEPLDHLLQQVQKESEAGCFLLRLQYRGNLFEETREGFADLLLRPIAVTALHYLFHFHGGHDIDALHTLAQEVFAMALSMAGECWYHCDVFFSRFPFKLVGLISPLATQAQKEETAREFLSTCPCCLDPHFSRKVAAAGKNKYSD